MKQSAQRAAILWALRQGPLTSLDAMRELGILRAAARVHELREEGHNIVTHWEQQAESGYTHRVASYVLLS